MSKLWVPHSYWLLPHGGLLLPNLAPYVLFQQAGPEIEAGWVGSRYLHLKGKLLISQWLQRAVAYFMLKVSCKLGGHPLPCSFDLWVLLCRAREEWRRDTDLNSLAWMRLLLQFYSQFKPMASWFQPNYRGSWEVLEGHMEYSLYINCLWHVHHSGNASWNLKMEEQSSRKSPWVIVLVQCSRAISATG